MSVATLQSAKAHCKEVKEKVCKSVSVFVLMCACVFGIDAILKLSWFIMDIHSLVVLYL